MQYGILLSCLLFVSCSKNTTSYESEFEDSIDVNFSGGQLASNLDSIRSRIDTYLRGKKQGFVSGVMTDGAHIDSMTLDVDLDDVNPKALIDMFVSEGVLPKDVDIEIHKDIYK